MAMNPDTNKLEPVLDALSGKVPISTLADSVLGFVRADGTPVPAHWSVFKVGEEVTMKGYRFKVGYLGESAILLEPVGPVLVGEGNVLPPVNPDYQDTIPRG